MEQKNSEYGHFSRSESSHKLSALFLFSIHIHLGLLLMNHVKTSQNFSKSLLVKHQTLGFDRFEAYPISCSKSALRFRSYLYKYIHLSKTFDICSVIFLNNSLVFQVFSYVFREYRNRPLV